MNVINDVLNAFRIDRGRKDSRFLRLDSDVARQALLQIIPINRDLVVEFFATFSGQLGSDLTGFLLLDAIREPSVVSSTMVLRNKHGMKKTGVVISDMVGYGVLVYDSKDDKVYNVDFEGGLERFNNGTLEPSFESFEKFLRWFFELPGDVGAVSGMS